MTAHGGARYDDQRADVIDAEFWAAIEHMSRAAARSHRIARFFAGARRGGR